MQVVVFPFTPTVTFKHACEFKKKGLKIATLTSTVHHIQSVHLIKSAHLSSCIISHHSLFTLSGVAPSQYEVSPTLRQLVVEAVRWVRQPAQQFNHVTVSHSHSAFPCPYSLVVYLYPLSLMPPSPSRIYPCNPLSAPSHHSLSPLFDQLCLSVSLSCLRQYGGGGCAGAGGGGKSITMMEKFDGVTLTHMTKFSLLIVMMRKQQWLEQTGGSETGGGNREEEWRMVGWREMVKCFFDY